MTYYIVTLIIYIVTFHGGLTMTLHCDVILHCDVDITLHHSMAKAAFVLQCQCFALPVTKPKRTMLSLFCLVRVATLFVGSWFVSISI